MSRGDTMSTDTYGLTDAELLLEQVHADAAAASQAALVALRAVLDHWGIGATGQSVTELLERAIRQDGALSHLRDEATALDEGHIHSLADAYECANLFVEAARCRLMGC
jgi:HEPN domain-containing protein